MKKRLILIVIAISVVMGCVSSSISFKGKAAVVVLSTLDVAISQAMVATVGNYSTENWTALQSALVYAQNVADLSNAYTYKTVQTTALAPNAVNRYLSANNSDSYIHLSTDSTISTNEIWRKTGTSASSQLQNIATSKYMYYSSQQSDVDTGTAVAYLRMIKQGTLADIKTETDISGDLNASYWKLAPETLAATGGVPTSGPATATLIRTTMTSIHASARPAVCYVRSNVERSNLLGWNNAPNVDNFVGFYEKAVTSTAATQIQKEARVALVNAYNATIYLTFTNYNVTDSTITNIVSSPTVDSFSGGFTISDAPTLVFTALDGETILTGENPVGTGTTMDVVVNDVKISTYTLVIYGDVNGDGEINLNDLTAIRDDITGVNPIADTLKQAGDLYGEGDITLNDLVGIMAYNSKSGDINQNPFA
jgi:hypothetical protein